MPYKLLAHIELISKIRDPQLHENRHTIAADVDFELVFFSTNDDFIRPNFKLHF